MEGEYEILKKYFIDKEKENIQLKEELELLKNKKQKRKSNISFKNGTSQSTHNLASKIVTSSIVETNSNANITTNFQENKMFASTESKDLNLNEINSPVQKFKVKKDLDADKSTIPRLSLQSTNFKKSEKKSKCEMNPEITAFNSPENSILNDQNFSNTQRRDSKSNYLEFGRLIDEKKNNTIVSVNKGVLKNIGNNISELKKHLKTYEKAYENINTGLDHSILSPRKDSNINLDDLNSLKENYEREIKAKTDFYEENIDLINSNYQDNIKKLRLEYEDKIENIIKQSEEEKQKLMRRITNLDNEVSLKNLKAEFTSESEDAKDVLEFQKKYLKEMKELQITFEEFKLRTFDEFKILREAKEEAINNSNYYKENYDKLLADYKLKENFIVESINIQKSKLEQIKILTANNEKLINQLDSSKNEINYLKSVISRMESQIGNRYILTNQNSYIQNDPQLIKTDLTQENYFSDAGEINTGNNIKNNFSQTGKMSDLVNYDVISNFYREDKDNCTFSPNVTNNIKPTHYIDGKVSIENNHKKHQGVDLSNAHKKIKEMEECLKSMNEENENLKGKLGYVINNMSNTPVLTENSVTNNYIISPMNHSRSSKFIYSPNKLRRIKNHSISLTANKNNNYQLKNSASFVNNTNYERQEIQPFEMSDSKPNNFTLRHEKDSYFMSNRSPDSKYQSVTQRKERSNVLPSRDAFFGESIDTFEDNIFELPLQLKIKGKIKNITATTSGKKKYSVKN